jgi:hypothetical protein
MAGQRGRVERGRGRVERGRGRVERGRGRVERGRGRVERGGGGAGLLSIYKSGCGVVGRKQ